MTRPAFLKLTACLLLIFANIPISTAQEQISGPVSGTLGPETYLVVGDIFVNRTDSLEILPGTSFLHQGQYTWFIEGAFSAVGTEEDSILFTSFDTSLSTMWGGLRFEYVNNDWSSLSYCTIENGRRLSPLYGSGGGIYTDQVNLTIEHCTIASCSSSYFGGGLYASECSIEIDNCDFRKCYGSDGGAVYLYYCDESFITNSVVTENYSHRV